MQLLHKQLFVFFILLLITCSGVSQSVNIEDLNLSRIEQGWETPKRGKNVSNKPITMAGKVYNTGLGTHATSVFKINLFKTAVRFQSVCGLDDMVAKLGGHSVVFEVIGDRKILWKSDTIRPGAAPVMCSADLKGIKVMTLRVTGYPGSWHTHVNWANASIQYEKIKPETWLPDTTQPIIVFAKTPARPVINGPSVLGVTPGKPILYKIPVSGKKPVTYEIEKLPAGLQLDKKTGILSGNIAVSGDYQLLLKANNDSGTDSKKFTIKVGTEIGLTPPLGWNSWNAWGAGVDRQKVMNAATSFINSELADYGWSYINIDDGWQGARDGYGVLQPNEKFGDIKSLADSIHLLGLKFGIYSSPGPQTCWHFPGSYRFEDIDAKTFADWGVDYLKYDWCSYAKMVPADYTVEQAIKPYAIMGEELQKQNRDIYYSLCQYGNRDVWKWAKSVHANSWRTTDDIYDSWASMYQIGFNQDKLAPYAEPGHINDPDMLVVGVVGWGNPRNSKLTPVEQMTHISLWTLLSAPMLLGCDVTKIDQFTKKLLTNSEVLSIHQDALVKSAKRIYKSEGLEIWKKQLSDGGTAIGIFNTDETDVVSYDIPWQLLQLPANKTVRNVWQQVNIGKSGQTLKGDLPYHSCLLLKVMP
jgi:alpha-galactosidase